MVKACLFPSFHPLNESGFFYFLGEGMLYGVHKTTNRSK
ncbi:hypothetical protein TAF16_2578 [Anoxybacillus flavithermus]|uniref:Uncharacterized protein n=1 Tax=Anoxybacillus flavithermus TaxID=33934 RepID=A0A178T574_9BACL|nr:hypothetical protein TAF16_2578 [Anoxybacillus flavithermus]